MRARFKFIRIGLLAQADMRTNGRRASVLFIFPWNYYVVITYLVITYDVYYIGKYK